MAKNSAIHIVRSILVVLTALLMIAIVVFQCCEISTYGIGDHIQHTLFDPIKEMISGDKGASEAAPAADNAAPPAGNPMAPPAE